GSSRARRRRSSASRASREALLTAISSVRPPRRAPVPTISRIRMSCIPPPRGGALQDLADARQELLRAERLDHVIVGAEVQRLDHVRLAILDRKDQDRDAAR